MRYLIAAAVAALLVPAARAHFVFVYVEGTEARLVFGHAAAPDPKTPADRCAKTALTARDAAGTDAKLPAPDKGDGNFYRAKLTGTPAVVFGSTEAGVTQRGDNPPMLSWYYPKAIVGDPFTGRAAVPTAALDIVPERDGEKVRFRVTANGQPTAGVEVTVGLPGVEEDKMPVVKTDADGRTTGFAERGRYGVAARKLDATAGVAGGKKYAAVRHTATLVFDFGTPAK